MRNFLTYSHSGGPPIIPSGHGYQPAAGHERHDLRQGYGERRLDPDRTIGSTDDLLYEAEQEYNDQDLSRITGKPLDEIQALPTCKKRESVMNHRKEELRRLVQVYYRQRGWNSSGIPTTETLKRLGLWDFLNGETKDKISQLTC